MKHTSTLLALTCIALPIHALYLPSQQQNARPAKLELDASSLRKRAPGPYKFEPILADDFPDPSIVAGEDNSFYAFATNNGKVHIQMARTSTPDVDVEWTLESDYDPLPGVGAWVNQGRSASNIRAHSVWAPDVYQLPDGRYIMYYAARLGEDTRLHCLGAAISTTGVRGPYVADEEEPFICDRRKGGNIDAAAFFDKEADKLYLVYKIDGNAIAYEDPVTGNASTPIMLQELDKNDGRTKIGRAVAIFDRCDTCEDGALVEAPTLMKSPAGRYFLFYSSGGYSDFTYTTKYAVAPSITGPYTRATGKPLLHTQNVTVSVGAGGGGGESSRVTVDISLVGPGGADIDQETGVMLFHQVASPPPRLVRPMLAARIQLNDDDTVEITDWYSPDNEDRKQCSGAVCLGTPFLYLIGALGSLVRGSA